MVTDQPHQSYRGYFRRLINDFERLCRKPTDGRLDDISFETTSFDAIEWKSEPTVTASRTGEWLVELICLIPIHIAVARENRFIPLKDGVLDAEFDIEMLGAEVPEIIDAITLGWYESIFRHYMATRPVKVVSSMGKFASLPPFGGSLTAASFQASKALVCNRSSSPGVANIAL